jgi:PE family
MSYVTTAPEALSATAANLAGIGATMSAQNSAAAAPTTGVVPAAADQVSALAAAQFCVHAQRPSRSHPSAAGEHPGNQRDVVRGH